MKVHEWSMLFLAHGIATFPIRFRDKRPKLKSWEMYKQELPSLDLLSTWFAGGNLHNYGVVMGHNDLAVFDFDDMESFWRWNCWTLEQGEGTPAEILASSAFTVKTSRGVHLYFRITEPGNNQHVNGLDIKRNGYVVGPGSTHPSGAKYTATNALELPVIEKLSSILPPEWIEKLANPPEPDVIQSYAVHTPMSSDPFDIASNPYTDDRNLIEQVKERVPLQSLFQNVTPSSNGFVMANCMFHPDHSPSFWINTKEGVGNCNKCQFPLPLDVINVYAKMHGISDGDAAKLLSNGG